MRAHIPLPTSKSKLLIQLKYADRDEACERSGEIIASGQDSEPKSDFLACVEQTDDI